jgi:SH3-like domain-containing protein
MNKELIKKKGERLLSLALVLGLAASLLFGTSYLPAHAQAVDGVLNDIGEGGNRVLTSDWTVLNPGQQITYQFAYDGDEQPVSVWMNVIPADGAIFQIWTDERLEQLSEDAETEPLGQGTAMTEGSGFTNWQGGSPEAETYYVVVSATGNNAARFLLNVSSPVLALEQPGAVAVEPTAPVAPLDPDIAVVTTTALNVRSGPSTAFAVLTTIPNGTQMTVLGRNPANTWINVQLADGTEGWVTRSLTSYTLVSPNIISPALPVTAAVTATTTATTSVATTATVPAAGAAAVAATTAVTATELGEGWQVLSPGEVEWYSFQYRGGQLPVTVWMDHEPFGDANFTVVDAETAEALISGTVVTPTTVLGEGVANPLVPGYHFWQGEFLEADIFYVMVEPADEAEGDVLYSIHALGPGVGRIIEPLD